MVAVKKLVSLPPKIVEVIEKLIEQGDYRNFSAFIAEACRSHLNTWYPKEWNEE